MRSLKFFGAAFSVITILFFSSGSAFAAQAAGQQMTISTNSALLAEPRADASVVAQLKQGTTAEQIGKQGMFLNVKTPAGTGWVYSFNVRFPSTGTASAGGGAGGPNLSGRVNVASTIGIRGLSAEDLRKTSTDAEQLRLLDSFAASAQDAEAAAAASGLAAVRVDYFNK
jgi:hypothetical protein